MQKLKFKPKNRLLDTTICEPFRMTLKKMASSLLFWAEQQQVAIPGCDHSKNSV
jgi:hypothetical protein